MTNDEQPAQPDQGVIMPDGSFRAARMMDAKLVREEVLNTVAGLEQAKSPTGRRTVIEDLIDMTTIYGRPALEALVESGHPLDQLTAEHEADQTES
ncbi:MAG: hypothetical protein ACI841_000078 [Planctomycetota bacterium]|jgi:hypothetical protein